MDAIFPTRNWKRPNDVAPRPKVWHKFRAEDKYGQTHEIQIQDMTPDQREEVWDLFKEHFFPDMDLCRVINILEDHESMVSVRLIFDHVVDQNLTIVATIDEDSKSRRVVGCYLLLVKSKQDSSLPKATFPDRNWKRPKDVPYPKVWHKFQAQDRHGKTHGIRIQDMTPDQYEEVWEIYKEHFCRDEEINRQVKILEDQESFASKKLNFDHLVSQNLSLVAVLDVDEDTKPCIVGCLQLMVISKEDAPLPKLPGVALAKIRNIYGLLRDDVNMFEVLNVNRYLKESGVVVKREYRQMNIGFELLKTMERMGKVFRIPVAVATFSNPQVVSLGAKLGFIVVKDMKLNGYRDEEYGFTFLDSKDPIMQYGYFKYF